MSGREAGDGTSERALLHGDATDEPFAWFPTQPDRRDGSERAGKATGAAVQPARATWKLRLRSGVARFADALRLEEERGAAFLVVAVLICVGAIIYFSMGSEPDGSALASAVAVAGVASWAVRQRPLLRLVPMVALVLLAGMALGKIETLRAGTKVIGGEITTRLTGRIVAVEERANGRTRLTIDVLSTTRPKLRYQPDRVRVTTAGKQEWRPGDTVEGVVKLMAPLGPLRPHSYDFAFESYFDGVGANGFFLGQPKAAEGPLPSALARMSILVERVREGLADRIRAHVGGAEGEIAAALVAGVRAGIPEEANEALRTTGLAHLLSISGLHMALVAGVVIGSLRAAFALFPAFSSRHPVRKYAAGLALVALTLYLLISGADVAARRSYIMIAVMLAALLVDRAALTMRNLAIAAIIVLVWSPHEAAGPSFQMSFAATAALIAAYGWWAERRQARPAVARAQHGPVRRVVRTVLLYGTGLAATSILAGLATGIFGAWHFQRISPLSLIANLAVMPIVSVFVMPAAVAGVLLMPFDLDHWAFVVMGAGLAWTLDIASWLAARSPGDVVGTIPPISVVLLAASLTVACLASTNAIRMLAILPLFAGVLSLGGRELPAVIVSEDGRLMAVNLGDGRMAINRARAPPFTTDDWARAMVAIETVRPIVRDDPKVRAQQARTNPARPGTREREPIVAARADGFRCENGVCLATSPGGGTVAHAETAAAAATVCSRADVIVVADATASDPCPGQQVQVITARQLALRGSADVHFDGSGPAYVRFALPDVPRPWHDHRRFSRSARGLAPYARPERKARAGQPAARASPASKP